MRFVVKLQKISGVEYHVAVDEFNEVDEAPVLKKCLSEHTFAVVLELRE